jgi:hypothetical protein
MKLFVLMNNIPHEFGECLGVYSSMELAEKAKLQATKRNYCTYTGKNGVSTTYEYRCDLDNLTIEEHELDQ